MLAVLGEDEIVDDVVEALFEEGLGDLRKRGHAICAISKQW